VEYPGPHRSFAGCRATAARRRSSLLGLRRPDLLATFGARTAPHSNSGTRATSASNRALGSTSPPSIRCSNCSTFKQYRNTDDHGLQQRRHDRIDLHEAQSFQVVAGSPPVYCKGGEHTKRLASNTIASSAGKRTRRHCWSWRPPRRLLCSIREVRQPRRPSAASIEASRRSVPNARSLLEEMMMLPQVPSRGKAAHCHS
jgi:hypothetical protein